MSKDNFFNEEHEVQNNWVKFSKIGDQIKGTLVDVRDVESRLPGQEGKKVKVYEIKAHEGEFHELDDKKNIVEPAIKVGEGEFWNVGGRMVIDNQMRNIKRGQIVGFRFTDEKPAQKKGYNSFKIIKVYAGEMDEEFTALKKDEEESDIKF